MVDEYKQALSEGLREAAKRSPFAFVLILETLVIVYIGWQLLSGSALERSELRVRNKELTEQLVECYRARSQAKIDVERVAQVSGQNDSTR